ncbi:glucose-6-phosphate dehydrogenase assembly protein OpcA [Millisia brevis]|uniref:glucose-6-phosphate dehydrogenase assembly protein OpcA n=1 Tax=Millisia brevis TaxID=264148 RepID=UPI0008315ADE|nr:glucose-6-phosphate dehydrogenase assembly protein OpcA [Millisia brevis]
MIVDIPETSTGEVSRRLVDLRKEGGAITLGRVLTLLVSLPAGSARVEEAITAAKHAGNEHPCRVIVLQPLPDEPGPGLDAQIRVGGDAGASEVLVLRLRGDLASHEAAVVIPFLLPDTPVVVWWPEAAPDVPAEDPLGALAKRRITDATLGVDPPAAIRARIGSYVAGDTDLAWSRTTPWRALLASCFDEAETATTLTGPGASAVVTGRHNEPAFDLIAGWLATRLNIPVTRTVGEPLVEITSDEEYLRLSRPQTELTGLLSRSGLPDALVPLARRDTDVCLAEELRRLDADEVYHESLDGIERVSYP